MHFIPHRENVNPIWVPQIGQKFRNLDDAWTFWVDYGGHAGFEVRKRYANESKYDGKITSCRFVCAKEGYRARDKRDHNTKNPRAETRTGCPVRIGLTLDRVEGTYEVLDLVLAHNHASFTWLFKAFLAAHNGKHPRTIFTNQDSAMGKAVRKVFIESWHGL